MPKAVVESCLELSARALMRSGILIPNASGHRVIVWKNNEGIETGRIGLQLQLASDAGGLRLLYAIDGKGVPYLTSAIGHTATVTTTRLGWGKLRWWFYCPRCNGPSRLDTLYLPPGARLFGCRHCYRLGYQSQREPSRNSRKSDTAITLPEMAVVS